MFLYIPPKECYSLFWQESVRSQGTTFTLWGPAVNTEGSRHPGPNWPPGSSGHPNRGAKSHTLHPMKTATAMRSQRRGWGRESPPPQGLGLASWVALERALEPCRTQLPACFLGPQLIHWPKAGWAGGPQGEGWDSPLISLSAWEPPLLWPLAE